MSHMIIFFIYVDIVIDCAFNIKSLNETPTGKQLSCTSARIQWRPQGSDQYIFILSLSSVQDISFFETVVFCHVCPEHQTTRLADDKPAETG